MVEQTFKRGGKLLVTLCAGIVLTACATTSGSDGENGSSAKSARVKAKKEPTVLTAKREQVVNDAKKFVGTPYRLGGTSPSTGFDCSGLVQHVYQGIDVGLPRTTREQEAHMSVAKRPAEGDVLFFKINGKQVSHAGIYVGNNRMVHAPGTGRKVEITRIDTPYWQSRLSKWGAMN